MARMAYYYRTKIVILFWIVQIRSYKSGKLEKTLISYMHAAIILIPSFYIKNIYSPGLVISMPMI
jgi:hypothetical protein